MDAPIDYTHLKFVIEHNGLFPDPGMGGCCCDTCRMIREHALTKMMPRTPMYNPAAHEKTSTVN